VETINLRVRRSSSKPVKLHSQYRDEAGSEPPAQSA
jgi:hypothetical protein